MKNKGHRFCKLFILRADQLVKLDNLIAARKERKNQFLGSNEIQKESEATATAAPDNGTDEEKVVGKTNEQDAIKNDPSDSEESTATTDETVETPEGKENINESLSFGIQAYNEKNYNQAVFYFNEVLKTDPNNAEAKKYLEYIKLAKMRMVKLIRKRKKQMSLICPKVYNSISFAFFFTHYNTISKFITSDKSPSGFLPSKITPFPSS
ncbi:MAG: hypothetical protein JRF25_11445 [Deltaproteobacteria bacterium]|nr:hypothetical protein [Deltaproteobacteria bacterium]